MKKLKILKIVGWVGMALFIIVSAGTGDILSYLSQGLFLGVVLLHAYKKLHIRTLIIVISILFFLVRLVGFTSGYDFIDMALWGAIIYLVW